MLSDVKQIYSYIVAQDNGYSPNPFMQCLTLPWCKPPLRKAIAKYVQQNGMQGVWLVGLTRKEKLGYNRLLYLARISEVLSHDEYFHRYPNKQPQMNARTHVKRVGDNAYYKENNIYQSLESVHSADKSMQERDLSVESVLISDYYIYYGKSADALPEDLQELTVGQGFKSNFSNSTKQALSAFVTRHAERLYNKTIIGAPHLWPEGDESWSNNQI